MQLIIHRGTKEIGGTCIELSTTRTRIIIDYGLPLVDDHKERFDPKILRNKSVQELKKQKYLFDIKGLYEKEEKGIDGILISHSHPDHYGLLDYVNKDIPVYLSQGVRSLIDISNIFISVKVRNLNTQPIASLLPFKIGDFKITPYLVDHSGFDAMAFLIEADGKKLFYSGDFRGHGRKSVLFDKMLKEPPKDIDCLLMEGSTLGRGDPEYKTELEVQKKIEEVLRQHENITFLFASAQNIDRIVSAYKSCLKTNTIFVIDIYAAYVLDKLRQVSKNIPQFNRNNIRVKYLKAHADRLAKAGHKELLNKYNQTKIEFPEINQRKNQILMLARDGDFFRNIISKHIQGLAGAKVLYSMWEGYLTKEFDEYCRARNLIIEKVHASGHATVNDLKSFAKAVKPKMLIPIHTFAPGKYGVLFDNVVCLDDGKSLII